MPKRKQMTDSTLPSKYPRLEDDLCTVHYDPCNGCVGTRDMLRDNDIPKDPSLLYNVVTFSEDEDNRMDGEDNVPMYDDKYIISTVCSRAMFEHDMGTTFTMPLRVDVKNDLTPFLLAHTKLNPNVISVITEYTKIYILTYHDFKYGVDCLFGHRWTDEEWKKFNDEYEFTETEHTLHENLPPTSLTSMMAGPDPHDLDLLSISFETND